MARVANGEVRDAVPSAKTRPRGEGMVLAAFVALVLIGGSNFVAVRFSNFSLPPLWAAGSRFATAAVILVRMCSSSPGSPSEEPQGRT